MYQQNQQGLYSDEHYLPNHGSPTRLFHNRFLPSFGPTQQKGKRRDLKIHSHQPRINLLEEGRPPQRQCSIASVIVQNLKIKRLHSNCYVTYSFPSRLLPYCRRQPFLQLQQHEIMGAVFRLSSSCSPGWVPHCVTFLHLHFSFSHRIPFILRHITSNHNVKPSSAPSHHSIPGNNIEPNLQLQHKINQYLWRHLQMQFRQKVLVSLRFKIFTQKAKNVRLPSDTKKNILSSSSIYRNSHARQNKNSQRRR